MEPQDFKNLSPMIPAEPKRQIIPGENAFMVAKAGEFDRRLQEQACFL